MTNTLDVELLAFAEQLADESRAIVKAALSKAHHIDIKADASFVTDTDRAIEIRLRERIEAAYPHHGILGEEFGVHAADSEFVWVIDPIDGTAAFIAGFPVYGTLIGVASQGMPWLGVMDLPATGERLTGVAGKYAFHNNKPIRCRNQSKLEDAFLTSSNPGFLSASERLAMSRLSSSVRYTQYGGSCYAYGCLARGNTDIAVDGGFDTYDVFAPIAIIEGAGGIVTDWTGRPITLQWQGQIIAAGDKGRHEQALELLQAAD